MGYLFVSLALLAGVTKGYCGKKTSGYVTEFKDTMLMSLFRMIICIIVGLAVLFFNNSISELVPNASLLAMSALSGFMTSALVVTWLYSAKNAAYMLVEIFNMLGVVVTIVLSLVVYGEKIGVREILGLAFLMLALFLMCSNSKKINVLTFVVLICCGLSSGLADFSQKIFVNSSSDSSVAIFQFYTYCFSAITLLVFYIIFSFVGRKRNEQNESYQIGSFRALKKSAVYIAVMAICLYVNSYFKTEAAALLPAARIYPLNQGGSLLLNSLMAAVLFKEKLSVRSVCGIVLAFAALLLINL